MPDPAGRPDASGRWAFLAREAARKLIHLAAAGIAAGLAWILPGAPRRALFAAVAIFALAIDVGRLSLPGLRRRFLHIFAPMLRGKEYHRLTGATTLAVGFMAAVVLFPREAAVTGLLTAAAGDAASALVGRPLGRHRYSGGKSLEGSLAFLLVAFLVGSALPALGPGHAAVLALGLALLEALPLPFDDNLLIPVAGAALTFLLSHPT